MGNKVEKKHNLIYQTTNIQSGKTYIGRHATNRLNDGYLGSGIELRQDIKKFGKKSFIRQILFDFDTKEEMYAKEIELLTEEFVNRTDTYNVTIGGSGGMLGKNHSPEVSQRLRESNVNLVSVTDGFGNYMRISRDDPRYLSGELKHNLKGQVSVKDSEGNRMMVKLDDPRYLSGELVSVKMGSKRPPETSKKHAETMKAWWKENTHTDSGRAKMSAANSGKVLVRDADGNKFKVPVDDSRIANGELVYDSKGRKQSPETCKKNGDNKTGCVWISHLDLKLTKLVKPDKVEGYLGEGWIRYRVCNDKFDSMKESLNHK